MSGGSYQGTPPHPNFCMKRRSVNKLIREVDNWHQVLKGMQDVVLETWEGSGFNRFEHINYHEEIKRTIRWTVQDLLTSQQLYAAGRIMSHCSGLYVRECASGDRSIWSLRALGLDASEENQILEHVLTIEVANKKRSVVQSRGRHNLKPLGKKHVVKERSKSNVYLMFLRHTPSIMRVCMDHEGLSHG